MTNRTISWIGLIPFLLWLIPIQAKKAMPELFGGPLFQWTAGAVNAVLIPVLVLMGLKLLATQDRKRAGLGLLFSAGFPMVALLFTYQPVEEPRFFNPREKSLPIDSAFMMVMRRTGFRGLVQA